MRGEYLYTLSREEAGTLIPSLKISPVFRSDQDYKTMAGRDKSILCLFDVDGTLTLPRQVKFIVKTEA